MRFALFPGLLAVWLFAVDGNLLAQSDAKPNLKLGKIQDIEIELASVPDGVGTGGKPVPAGSDSKTSQDARWLRIDVPFSTQKKVTPEVKLKFFLEGYEYLEGKGGAKDAEKFVVLTGEVSYRDVPKGDKHYAGVFLSPSSMLRFAGTEGNVEAGWVGKKLNLRVEVLNQDEPVVVDLLAEKESGPNGWGGKKNPDWYKGTPPPGANIEAGAVLEGVLLPVTETPFWPKDFKRYPQPKKP